MTREKLLEDLELLINWSPTPERRKAILEEAIRTIREIPEPSVFRDVGPAGREYAEFMAHAHKVHERKEGESEDPNET